MTRDDERKTAPGHCCYQPIIEITSCSIIVPGQNQGLARRNSSPSPLSSNQISPKTLWTLRDHKRDIPCGLSVMSSRSLEHPQHFSRITLISLSRNEHTQAQLLKATS